MSLGEVVLISVAGVAVGFYYAYKRFIAERESEILEV